MIDFLPYIVKSGLSFAVFYVFYLCLLKKETSLNFNRFYLIGTAILAVVAPLLTLNLTAFGLGQTMVAAAPTSDVVYTTAEVYTISETTVATNAINWNTVLKHTLIGLYLLGFSALLFRFMFNLTNVIRNIIKGEKLSLHQLTLVLNQKDTAPHTFLKYIFLNKKMYQEGAIENDVITHEKAHVEQWHSIDIILMEVFKIVFWFNPFVWLYKRDIQLNHEYLADQAVIKETPIIQYQTAIIRAIEQTNATNLVSNFNYSSTKKRFIMMTKTKTKKSAMIARLALLLPLTMAVFFLSVQLQAQDTKPEVEVEKVEKSVNPEEKKEITSDNEKPNKKEVEKIKEEIIKVIEDSKELTEKERKALQEKLEKLDVEMERLHVVKDMAKEKAEVAKIKAEIAKAKADIERKKVYEIRKEIKGEGGKKMIIISEDGKEIQFFEDDNLSNGEQIWITDDGEQIEVSSNGGKVEKKIFISTDGEEIELLEFDGAPKVEKKVIFIEKDGEKVISLNDEAYQYKYEWKSDDDFDIDVDVDVKEIVDDIKKEIKVIVNGKSIDINSDDMLKDLDENIQVIINEAIEGANIEKTIKIIELESEENTKSNKKKNRKKKK